MALLLSTAASAQEMSTTGRDFWLTFMLNMSDLTGERTLMMAGEEGTTVAVVANNGWNDTLEIDSTGVLVCNVPDIQGLVFHVTSDADISVYASNYYEYTYDIATVYPTQSLGWHYMVQSYDVEYDPDVFGPEVAVVAVEDSTRVLLVPKGGTMRTVWLDAGEAAYFYWDPYIHGDDTIDGLMTGTQIYSYPDKPIAVFQGSQCAHVGHSACDHLFEQSVPIDYWGRQFVVVPIAARQADDVVRILSASYGCRVTINDTTSFTLNAGEFLDTIIHTAICIGSTGPVSVCMYMSGGRIGDPSAILIPPVDQGVPSASFAAINTEISTVHYANVVTQTCHAGAVTLDGVAIDSAFTAFDDRWSYAQISVTPGTHRLANSDGTLNVWFYGMGPAESYGYIAGMSLVDHTPSFKLDSTVLQQGNALIRCVGDTLRLELGTDTAYNDTRWTLDDAVLPTTSLQLTLPIDSVGTHVLKAMLHGDCCREWCDSLELTLYVYPTYNFVEEDGICEGVPYEWHGQTLTTAGTFVDSLRTMAGCDSVTTLNLEPLPFPQPSIEVEADCQNHTYTLSAIQRDTLHWTTFQWSASPADTMLSGLEGDSTIYITPAVATFVTLHAMALCAADTTVLLRPIVWPTARLEVRPKTIVASYNSAFDAYDMSLDATSREWTVGGMPLGDAEPHINYPVSGAEDSIEVLLTAINDYCRDTARAVVWVINEGVYAPNVFTPSQDINNRFTVYSSNEIDGELSIYNREGLLLYSTTDLADGWDGGGQPQGAYVWHLRYRYRHAPQRWHTAVGTVTLLK